MNKDEELVKDLDDLDFETKVDSNEMEDLEDISEEELQEIESLVDKKSEKEEKKEEKKKTSKKDSKKKSKKKKSKKKKPKKKKKKTKKKKKSKKKKTKKKNNKKKTSKKSKKKKGKSVFYIVAAFIIIALVVAGGFMTNWFTSPESATTEEGEIVAKVNGEAIYMSALNKRYEEASRVSMVPLAKEDVLNNLIEQELIEQKAEELGITVEKQEAEESLNELLATRGLTRDQLEANLQTSGMSIEDLLDDFEYYVLIDKLANQTFASNVTVTGAELANYVTPRIYVRHILLMSEQENETIYNRLTEVKEELEEDDSKFCDYVVNMSEDTGSINNCGRYFFGKGEMVPEFEEAAFSLEKGKMSIVKSDYGYHLIQRIAVDEEKMNEIKEQLEAQKANENYADFVADSRENAEIEIMLDNATEESPFDIIEGDNETEELEPEEEIVEPVENVTGEEELEEEIVENVTEEEEIVEEPVENVTGEEELEEEIVENVTGEEELVEEPEEIIYETPEVKYFYSESDEKQKEMTQLIKDLENQGYIDVEWRCVKVNPEDKELCIEFYSEYDYETSMQEAKELGLKYAPTIFIDDEEYTGDYKVEDVREAICNIAGC